jgi:hypothetical protein
MNQPDRAEQEQVPQAVMTAALDAIAKAQGYGVGERDRHRFDNETSVEMVYSAIREKTLAEVEERWEHVAEEHEATVASPDCAKVADWHDGAATAIRKILATIHDQESQEVEGGEGAEEARCSMCGRLGWVLDCNDLNKPGPRMAEFIPCFHPECTMSGQPLGVLSFKGVQFGHASMHPRDGWVMSLSDPEFEDWVPAHPHDQEAPQQEHAGPDPRCGICRKFPTTCPIHGDQEAPQRGTLIDEVEALVLALDIDDEEKREIAAWLRQELEAERKEGEWKPLNPSAQSAKDRSKAPRDRSATPSTAAPTATGQPPSSHNQEAPCENCGGEGLVDVVDNMGSFETCECPNGCPQDFGPQPQRTPNVAESRTESGAEGPLSSRPYRPEDEDEVPADHPLAKSAENEGILDQEAAPQVSSGDGEWPTVWIRKDIETGPESGWSLIAPGDPGYPGGVVGGELHHRVHRYKPIASPQPSTLTDEARERLSKIADMLTSDPMYGSTRGRKAAKFLRTLAGKEH